MYIYTYICAGCGDASNSRWSAVKKPHRAFEKVEREKERRSEREWERDRGRGRGNTREQEISCNTNCVVTG